MEDKQLTEDYLRIRLQTEINNVRISFISCTMSTIRWIQRYSHCYSIMCSLFCFPLWILMLPIAFVLDICIYFIAFIIFIIVFIINILLAPCTLAYKFSSCSDAWKPVNIYRYSLREALFWFESILMIFQMPWLCYCGSGHIEDGAPICCTYICCMECHNACSKATQVKINNQSCIIL
ncbi:unnamed protein product [Rotaria sp. Silwood2]|nr:unnamed protein product [Rotaria sp. Silwood2]CAF3270746.1 unnamed protein product [Rotaria sp. Silwood2]CAF4530805.1 unnamed protein product [Rotaria sp. Silwood2]CAF4637326.1 unnamed protein product [Rotaria sp. Silwood2]